MAPKYIFSLSRLLFGGGVEFRYPLELSAAIRFFRVVNRYITDCLPWSFSLQSSRSPNGRFANRANVVEPILPPLQFAAEDIKIILAARRNQPDADYGLLDRHPVAGVEFLANLAVDR